MPSILRKVLEPIKQYSEIFIAFAIIAIIGIIVVPINSNILDFLFVLNITLGISILLLTLFTKDVLDFSTFPTLLLVTTMFRLSLNISSTRLILSDGDAGYIIDAFANFVTGNNYIVGGIIFIIIVVVQMVVVTSGASRVSEVSARFTLDAMPGKQMAIDADLNSGVIDEQTAKKRRQDLQRQANFYGAMDGASKFVKGDAIAGIIITIINLLGGILIFSIQTDMGVMAALDKFGKLTIGDGLVSQIPSLLISVASAILVTRSDNGSSFGKTVGSELLGFSKVTLISAVVLLFISFIPAFPTLPFLIVAIILGSVGYLILENEREEAKVNIKRAETQVEEENTRQNPEDNIISFQVDPISLEIGYGLISITDSSDENNLINHIVSIRRQIANELGVVINPIRIRDNLQLGPNEYIIKIKGNKISGGEIYLNKYMAIEPGDEEKPITGIQTKEPAFGLDALWIEEVDKDKADMYGYTIVEPVTVLVTHLKEIIKSNSHELLGRQEVRSLLESLKERYNVVVDELIPEVMSLGEVQKVLQNLLKEKVPINDMVTILETLADYGSMTKDIELLTEYTRQSLKRTIVKKHLNEEGNLSVVTLHPDLEELISKNIQKSSSGSIPVLQPNMINKIFDNVQSINNSLMNLGMETVILASPKIRVAFKNLISFTFPNLDVLSLNEVPNDVNIESLGMVESI